MNAQCATALRGRAASGMRDSRFSAVSWFWIAIVMALKIYRLMRSYASVLESRCTPNVTNVGKFIGKRRGTAVPIVVDNRRAKLTERQWQLLLHMLTP